MIEISGLSARYNGQPVLDSVSLTIRGGEVLALVGPNGSGKSTLLRTILRLHEPCGGQIRIDGEAMAALTARQIAQKIAYLPQSRNVPDITVRRMVLHGRFPYLDFPRRYRQEDYVIVDEALTRVGSSSLADRPMDELSGGQRQNVYVAMALAQQTDTVLMDEPTTYMDVHRQMALMEMARSLARQGTAMVMVLHDLCLALRYADRLAVLDGGQIVLVGTPGEIWDSVVLEHVFRVRIRRVQGTDGWRYYYD